MNKDTKRENKALADATEYDSRLNYTCPICLTECNEYESCGCEMEINLPKD